MLFFGHPGITLGAATLFAGALERRDNKITWFSALSRYVDIRLLLVGSLLPDIIDKPVGQYLFRETFNNGRIFSHSLLFFILISAVGFYLLKRHRQTWLLALAAGTFTHLFLDEMWRTPAILFWPFLGFSFPAIELEGWASSIFTVLFSKPGIYIPEIIGLAILLWFGAVAIRKRKVGALIKYGKVI